MRLLLRAATAVRPPPCFYAFANHLRPLTSAATLAKNVQLPARPKVDESEIEEKFLKGSGPGGQKINKTNSAVQLHHIPSGRVVKCQETRSRTQNRKIARRLLAEKLEEDEKGEDSRTALKGKAKSQKKASAKKKSNRKYRALEEEKRNSLGLNEEEPGREERLPESETLHQGHNGLQESDTKPREDKD